MNIDALSREELIKVLKKIKAKCKADFECFKKDEYYSYELHGTEGYEYLFYDDDGTEVVIEVEDLEIYFEGFGPVEA